jgi:hypothetical protein
MLAHARVDYGQEFPRTRIPKPTITAVKKAYARRTSRIPGMMGVGEEVEVAPEYKETDPAEESEESEVADIVSSFADKAEVGADNEYTDVFVPIYDPNEPGELEHSGLSQEKKTSLMFNDKSFDEDLDPDAQTPGFNVFERRIVRGKRVGMGFPTPGFRVILEVSLGFGAVVRCSHLRCGMYRRIKSIVSCVKHLERDRSLTYTQLTTALRRLLQHASYLI